MRRINKKIAVAVSFSILFHVLVVFLFLSSFVHDPFDWGGGSDSQPSGVIQVMVEFTQAAQFHPSFVSPQRTVSHMSDMVRQAHHVPVGSGVNGIGTSPAPVGGVGDGYDESAATGSGNVLALIRQKIFRQKYYPLAAKSQGLEGVVEVTFRMGENGALNDVAVARSSGHRLLDEEAIDTVSRAQPFPYYNGDIRVALEYDLDL